MTDLLGVIPKAQSVILLENTDIANLSEITLLMDERMVRTQQPRCCMVRWLQGIPVQTYVRGPYP